MVFTSIVQWARTRGPDEFWRKRKIFKLAAHYIGRRRNCYSITIKNVHRALVYASKGRQLKKEDFTELRNARITAACEQHNITHFILKEGLQRANVMLDRKSLADLACWEPQTFQSLAAVAKERLRLDDFVDSNDNNPTGTSLNLENVFLSALKDSKK